MIRVSYPVCAIIIVEVRSSCGCAHNAMSWHRSVSVPCVTFAHHALLLLQHSLTWFFLHQIVLWTAVFTAPNDNFRSYVAGENLNFGSAQPADPLDLSDLVSHVSRYAHLVDVPSFFHQPPSTTLLDTKQGGSTRFKFPLSQLRQGPASLTLSPARVNPTLLAPRPPNAAPANAF